MACRGDGRTGRKGRAIARPLPATQGSQREDVHGFEEALGLRLVAGEMRAPIDAEALGEVNELIPPSPTSSR